MKFKCQLERLASNGWQAKHTGLALGTVTAHGATPAEAIEKLRGELRYCLELCPCTGESYRHLEIEIE